MKKKSYYLAPTTLNEFLNEQKSVTLTRKYGEKNPVVVGTRAPVRNQILSFVAENQQISRIKLKRFIAGLNEGSKNPNAAANMWLKRNSKFFIAEEKSGITVYKLSKLGHKLLERMSALAESKINEKNEKDYDFKVNGKKGIHDEKEENLDEAGSGEAEDVDEKCDESAKPKSKKERIQELVEQIRAKRAQRLYEEDEIEEPEEDEEDEEGEEPAEDVETPDEESEEEEKEEGEEEDMEDEEETEGDDKVEVTEFIISVDDVEEALAELSELGIEAEEVAGEAGDDMDMDMDFEEPAEGGEEEVDDFDLDLGGDIEGEEEDMEGEEEMEESVTGMEKFSKQRNSKYGKSTANLTEEEDDEMDEMQVTGFGKDNKKSFKKSDPGLLEDEDELGMDDLDLEEPEEGGEESEEVDMDIEGPEGEEGAEFDMEEAPEGGSQIRVSAEQWPALKKWLEEKGVDIEEMFGGEIEMEGEDVEDEISFDGLEDTGEEKGGEEEKEEDVDVDVDVDVEDEDEEVEEGYKK
jgi:hypothetical protein